MFKEGSGLEEPLLCFYAIFGLLEQLFMVAEATDQHEGGPGRVEEGQKGLCGRNVASPLTWVFLVCSHILHLAVS